MRIWLKIVFLGKMKEKKTICDYENGNDGKNCRVALI